MRNGKVWKMAVAVLGGLMICVPASATVLLEHIGSTPFASEGWTPDPGHDHPITVAGEPAQGFSEGYAHGDQYYKVGLFAANPGLLTIGWRYDLRLLWDEAAENSGDNQITFMVRDGAYRMEFGLRGGNIIESYYDGAWQYDSLAYGTGWNNFRVQYDPSTDTVTASLNGITFYSVVRSTLLSTTSDMVFVGLQGAYDDGAPYNTGACSLARFTLGPPIPPPVTVTGQVVLGDYLGDPSVPVAVKVELRQGGAPVVTTQKVLDATGQFTIGNVEQGTYEVAIKSYGHLQKVLTGVTVSDTATDLGLFELTGGDGDGDNEVTTSDLATVLLNMDLVGE